MPADETFRSWGGASDGAVWARAIECGLAPPKTAASSAISKPRVGRRAIYFPSRFELSGSILSPSLGRLTRVSKYPCGSPATRQIFIQRSSERGWPFPAFTFVYEH